jgi:hypothetical protein
MTFLCINTFDLSEINQYCTGLKCVSYSITQNKSQLYEINKKIILQAQEFMLFMSSFMCDEMN